MIIRKYKPSDCPELIRLFRETVHTVNAYDYTPEQLTAWTDNNKTPEEWNNSFMEHYTVVAVDGIIKGFGDIDSSGYLDRLFVHKDFQRQKIATYICDVLEKNVTTGQIITHSSITAKPFFLNRGYYVVKEQQVFRNGIYLINYIMKKSII
ncbi:MAG: GNAT family N-acetyltransferase [Prevotella sp.]|nr:GNAT family N-acetyltransferase [Alistipes senegalensis]MCM1358143.1 GNAT family N-acetyltransferase [Prevotella sp.]MCM1473922.1 GNAT family N-acetyltransferase [Muribaculaceae bacterium]